MPTAFTHILVATLYGKTIFSKNLSARVLILSILCSILPDFDVIGFYFGIKYEEFWGHRGFFHSLTFALCLAVLIACTAFRQAKFLSGPWWKWVAYFFLLTASHGFLDAFTNGGLGIAFFSPFDATRYFFSWRPLQVSPIGIIGFFNEYGGKALWSEIVWVWVPAFIMATIAVVLRKKIFPRSL